MPSNFLEYLGSVASLDFYIKHAGRRAGACSRTRCIRRTKVNRISRCIRNRRTRVPEATKNGVKYSTGAPVPSHANPSAMSTSTSCSASVRPATSIAPHLCFKVDGRSIVLNMPSCLRRRYYETLGEEFICHRFQRLHRDMERAMEIRRGPWPGEVVFNCNEILPGQEWKLHGPTDVSMETKVNWLKQCRVYDAVLKSLDRMLGVKCGVWGPGVKTLLQEQRVCITTELDAKMLLLYDFSFMTWSDLDLQLGRMTILEEEARVYLLSLNLPYWLEGLQL